MKGDILTLSRVGRELKKINIDLQMVDIENENIQSMLLAVICTNKDIFARVYRAIDGSERDREFDKQKVVDEYLHYVIYELGLYSQEVKARQEHAINLGVYALDSEEVILKKIEENKDIYRLDHYLSCHSFLAKNNIDASILTISEALIIMENLLCEEVNKSIAELLAYIADDNQQFVEQVKKEMKHSNFYAFALDIHEAVNNMYLSIEKRKKNKAKQ